MKSNRQWSHGSERGRIHPHQVAPPARGAHRNIDAVAIVGHGWRAVHRHAIHGDIVGQHAGRAPGARAIRRHARKAAGKPRRIGGTDEEAEPRIACRIDGDRRADHHGRIQLRLGRVVGCGPIEHRGLQRARGRIHAIAVVQLAARAGDVHASARERDVEAGEPVVRRHHVVRAGGPDQSAIGAAAGLHPEGTRRRRLHGHQHGVLAGDHRRTVMREQVALRGVQR